MRAARDDAAGGQAVVRTACATDRATLVRVAAILRGHIGGDAPVLRGYWPPTLAIPVPVRRSCTQLEHLRGQR